jgi:hypothetical protein
MAFRLLYPDRTFYLWEHEPMVNEKEKSNVGLNSSQRQSRLMTESLKLLLGQGLTHSRPQGSEREQRAHFLRNALKTELLIQ